MHRGRNRNGIYVLINEQLLRNVVQIRWKSDTILLVNLVLGSRFLIILVQCTTVEFDESII